MGWQERLRKASFRGVDFYVDDDNTYESGRRLINHEFPNRDIPFSEDLGRKQRKFDFSAYLIGEDYDLQRNRLINALELKGPGALVHPNLGVLTVTVAGFTITHSKASLGMCKVELNFLESGSRDIVVVGQDSFQKLLSDADNALSVNDNSLLNKLRGYADIGIDTVNRAREYVQAINDRVEEIVEIGDVIPDTLSELSLGAVDLVNDIDTLLRQPINFVNRLSQSFRLVGLSFGNAQAKFNAYIRFVRFSLSSPDLTETVSARTTRSLEKDLNDYVRVSAQSYAAQNLVELPKNTLEEYISERNRVVDPMNQVLEEVVDIFGTEVTIDAETYEALSSVKASLISTYPAFNETFIEERVVTVEEETPTLVLYYDLKGNVEGEEDFSLRNEIENPLFAPANTDLKYL